MASNPKRGLADRIMTLETMNPHLIKMQYAVRGALVIRAGEIEEEMARGVKKPFDTVIRANIGDAHAMGQKPITFLRQVVSLCVNPELLECSDYPVDAKERAKRILKASSETTECRGHSAGSYSDSPGISIIRKDAAKYIEERDGGIPANWEDVILCAGASEGIRACMKVLNKPTAGKQPGIMIPIPQYPLYSASIDEYGMKILGYYLAEEKNWALEISELERALEEGRKVSNPVALCVINPGNPTGQVLTRDNIVEIIKFAQKERLVLFADEVYQHNIYAEGSKFYSFKSVMKQMGPPYSDMELCSFMSTSKGYMGECGFRGGYSEVVNFDPEVKAMLLKSISAKLCPTVLGQCGMDVVVNPPREGEPSYEAFEAEKEAVLSSLASRAKMVCERFNQMPGIKCNTVQGAMYAFPQISLPRKAIDAAREKGQQPDFFYCWELLEETGICVIPGSGFGQKEGTYHIRTTILPQPDLLKTMLDKMADFHAAFMKKYE
ncbi:unnamed protein product [Cyprideis torosa]|nr:unnamed protein product [Cyprideis torosa]CAG0881129.1 unnamed protein product [Cyprideis torosa]